MRKCKRCGEKLPLKPPGKRGPAKQYCDLYCRQGRARPEERGECETCGGSLVAIHHRFCSDECRQVEKVCPICRDTFTSSRLHNLTYCGNACAGVARSGPAGKADVVKECEWCGVKFRPSKYKVNIQRFHCKECRRAWEAEYRDNRPEYTYTCIGCGKVFKTKRKGMRYHSRKCAFEHYEDWLVNEARELECVQCGAVYRCPDGYNDEYCSQQCRDEAYTMECEICGEGFVARTSQQNICDYDECYKERARQRAVEYGRQRHAEMTEPRRCKECGYLFSPIYGSKARKFCSFEHRKRYSNRLYGSTNLQRAKMYGVPYEYFDEMAVLKRDGWRCYICGRATPRRLRGTRKPNAPEVDHVVPLARGGPHIPENARCCCRDCNIEKSDQTLEEYVDQAQGVLL